MYIIEDFGEEMMDGLENMSRYRFLLFRSFLVDSKKMSVIYVCIFF